MIALLLPLFACSDAASDTGVTGDDEEECPGPAIEDFASTYAELYCPWLQACPEPPGIVWSRCVEYFGGTWLDRADRYQACRAQECLDYMNTSLEPCQDNGAQWVEVEVCAYSYVTPDRLEE